MYTHCPECRASFRVTAEVLQQAAGRVRCGGCGHAFNALERLSKAPPGDSGRRAGAKLLDDFDALSGTGNVHLEDTGVEWQVVEDEEPAPPVPQASLELVNRTAADEQRYDDNTPLPGLMDDGDEEPTPEPPRRRAEDLLEPRSPEFDERQVDLALSEPEEWTDLLAEVGDASPDAATEDDAGQLDWQADEDTHSDLEVLDADAESTGEHLALQLEDDDGGVTVDDDGGMTLEDDPSVRAGATGEADEELTLAVDEPLHAAGSGEAPPPAEDEPAPAAGAGHYVPPPTEEEITINRLIDQDLLRLSQEQQDLAATSPGRQAPAEAPPHVETIIMEGAFVRTSLGGGEPDAVEDAANTDEDSVDEIMDFRDTYVRTRDSERPGRRAGGGARYAAASGIVVLALLLGAQVVHAWRETLATYGAFGESLISVYEAAGAPITPEWDANGWQFHDTRGSTGAGNDVLTISSTLLNASEQALPYPLLHIALTDRYEEIIASQLLEASQYLEIRVAGGRVAPGGRLKASVTIAPLSPQAEGYKLNVCYPLSARKVRCATGAFE